LYSFTPLQLESSYKNKTEEDAANFYNALGKQCATNRVALDIVIHTRSELQTDFLDTSTLGEVCRETCGKLIWLAANDDWRTSLYTEIKQQIRCFSGWDAVFKLRCSAGLQIKSFVCHNGVLAGGLVESPELEMSCVLPTTNIAIELEHRVGGLPKNARFFYVQSALLYSTTTGDRRVRVSTLALRVSSSAQEVFRCVDFSTTAAFLLRRTAFRLRTVSFDLEERGSIRAKAKESVYHECIHILGKYRKLVKNGASQLLLPEKLRLLPLFCMCLVKSTMLRPGIATRIAGSSLLTVRPTGDERAYLNWHAAQSGPATSMLFLYPRILRVDSLDDGDGDWREGGAEQMSCVQLPPAYSASMESMQDDRIYLVDDGLRIFLFVGKDVPDNVKQQYATEHVPMAEWNPALDRLLWQLRAVHGRAESSLRPTYAPLIKVFQKEGHQSPLEANLLDLMVEDAICGDNDYNEFLIRLHQKVRDRAVNA